MPIYEYACQKCGKNLEIMQKMSEAPKTKCPECAGKLVKLVSASGFQLKGTGWYKTDYAKPSSGTASKTPSKEKTADSPTPAKEAKKEPS